jgi:hypothetical protein
MLALPARSQHMRCNVGNSRAAAVGVQGGAAGAAVKARILQQFDNRAATYDAGGPADVLAVQPASLLCNICAVQHVPCATHVMYSRPCATHCNTCGVPYIPFL